MQAQPGIASDRLGMTHDLSDRRTVDDQGRRKAKKCRSATGIIELTNVRLMNSNQTHAGRPKTEIARASNGGNCPSSSAENAN